MAQSRLEKIGTIYTRTKGLIRSGALSWEDRPIWYDVYESFPPKEAPRFDRPAPNLPLKSIFYPEDKVRAVFHRNNKQIGAATLLNNNYKTLTQRFIENYKKIEAQYDGNASEEQLYKETIDIMKREREVKMEQFEEDEPVSLSTAFKEAQKKEVDQPKIGLTVKDIFKS